MRDCGLTAFELHQLATYNAEIGRGIVHTIEYDKAMELLQDKYDKFLGIKPL